MSLLSHLLFSSKIIVLNITILIDYKQRYLNLPANYFPSQNNNILSLHCFLSKKSNIVILISKNLILLVLGIVFTVQPICDINNSYTFILIFIMFCSCNQHFWISIFYSKQWINFSFECFIIANII